jgi:cytochrome c-type biogenesis protein
VNPVIEVSFWGAFVGGLLSFFSPCVLPLVPAYIANLAGSTALETVTRKSIWPTLFHSLAFVIGFSIIFIIMGASVGWLSEFITLHQGLLQNIAGVLIIIFGIIMLAAFKVPWLNYEKRLNINTARNPGYIRSLLIGSSFALGWTPCLGPVLVALMTYASTMQNIGKRVTLFGFYSAGMAIPFILMGLFWGALAPLWRQANRYLWIVSIISGVLLILIGILMLTNNLSWFRSFTNYG